jgi:TPR repeat protein
MPSASRRRGTVSTATLTFDFWGIMRPSLEAVIAIMLCFPSGWVHVQTRPPDQSSFTALKGMAESGDVEAQSKLGAMYMSGDGVQKDLATGFRWSYRAALRGSATAARMVSNAYSSGLGIPLNQAAAFDWARIAATRADPGSQGAMIVYYSKGLGVAKDLRNLCAGA